jgi:hypothetical protein
MFKQAAPPTLSCIALGWVSLVGGCGAMERTWHEKFNWEAADYFDDPQVIALCEAIEASDLEEIDRLVAAGADVNAKGKGNMTPLLWAFPDNKPERFKKVLELGADPNVIVESDFNTQGRGIRPGDSVTHMACKTWFPKHFDYVFAHGGDANLWHREKHRPPLQLLLVGPAKDKKQKVQKLIDLGADLNANRGDEYTGGSTPVITATSTFGQYDLALLLLEAGADYQVYLADDHIKLIHVVAMAEKRRPQWSPQQERDYQNLVDWLESHGESVESAKADLERWGSWHTFNGEYRRKMDAEIARRKAREAAKQGDSK